MFKNNKIFFILIFIAAFAIRFFNANQYPPLLWDEASIGYNAYSILQTGKDEYGQILPIIFKSFGDYKPGVYIYLVIPFVKALGLTTLAVRLPSIILGSLIPIFLFLLIKEINQKAHKTAVIAAILTVFNPYSIHFSKGGWETNILTFELILASYLFFKFINTQKSKFIVFSSLIFGLTLFTYQAGKMISLFLIIVLFLINIKKINFKKFIPGFIIPLFIFSIPIVYGLLFSQNGNRLNVVSLFSYPRNQEETTIIKSESNQIDYDVFHNHYLFFGRNFLLRYFNHFSPRFLAFEGDWQSPRHSAPYIGVLLYPSLIFLVIGIFFALSRTKIDKINWFFLFWLLMAPIPAALTRDTVQAVRSMSFSIPLIYFAALGIYCFTQKFKNIFIYFLIIGAYLISFIYYGDLYLNHMVKKSPSDFLYGYKETMNFVNEYQNQFNQVYVTDFYGQPYIFYLFYSKYDPVKYQSQAKLIENSSGDTGTIGQIDKIKFGSVQFDYVKNLPKTLSIFSLDEIYRQGIDKKEEFKKFIPLSPINGMSTFYAYQSQ